MIISKQALSCQMLFSFAFALLILIIFPSLLSILLPVKPVMYFYLLFNLLVAVVGVRSGLLEGLSKPSEYSYHLKNATGPEKSSYRSSEHANLPPIPRKYGQPKIHSLQVELICSDEVNHSPSIFFVGSDSYEDEIEVQVQLLTVDDVDAGKELHTRADDFIAKFHKHLKMQREVSWKKLQDCCLKPF